jgi:hypothetical protein
MSTEQRFETQRLDHLGIAAGICQEIGLVDWSSGSKMLFAQFLMCGMWDK